MTEQLPTEPPVSEHPPPEFLEPGLSQAIAHVLARQFEAERGRGDRDRFDELVKSCGLNPYVPEAPEEAELVTADTDALQDLFRGVVENVAPSELTECIPDALGTLEGIAACSSAGFAVMTAGEASISVIRRDGWVVVVSDWSQEDGDVYLGTPFRESDDPALRATRLAALAEFGGLQPGVYGDDPDLYPELRDITFECSEFASNYREVWSYRLDDFPEWLDDFIEETLPAFMTSTGRDEVSARARLAELLPSGEPTDEAERDAIWTVWIQLRDE